MKNAASRVAQLYAAFSLFLLPSCTTVNVVPVVTPKNHAPVMPPLPPAVPLGRPASLTRSLPSGGSQPSATAATNVLISWPAGCSVSNLQSSANLKQWTTLTNKTAGTNAILISAFSLQPSTFFRAIAGANGCVTLAWSPSPSTNVAGYNVYFGPAARTYTNLVDAGTATNATISGLIVGRVYYFAATAYDVAGMESVFSNEATNNQAGPRLAIKPM